MFEIRLPLQTPQHYNNCSRCGREIEQTGFNLAHTSDGKMHAICALLTADERPSKLVSRWSEDSELHDEYSGGITGVNSLLHRVAPEKLRLSVTAQKGTDRRDVFHVRIEHR